MVAPLIGIQKKAQKMVKVLKVAEKVVDHLQEWASMYPYTRKHLENKDMIIAKIDRV